MLDILRSQIPEIAIQDPYLAYRLWNLSPYSSVNTESVHLMRMSFVSASPDQKVISAQLDPLFCDDSLVFDISYQVRRPFAFSGNIFKANSDYFNSLNPCVDVTVRVAGGTDYIMIPNGPIESIARIDSSPKPSRCSCPFVISYCETPIGEFSLTRTLADDELPYEIIMSWHAVRLGCRNYRAGISYDEVCSTLSEAISYMTKHPDYDLKKHRSIMGLGDPNARRLGK